MELFYAAFALFGILLIVWGKKGFPIPFRRMSNVNVGVNPPAGANPMGAPGPQVNLNVNPQPSRWQRWMVTPVRYVSSPFESKWGIAALLVIGLLVFGLISNDWNHQMLWHDVTAKEWNGIPKWVLVLGLMAFVVMLISANFADVRASTIMVAIILFTVFAYTFYVNGGIDVGYRRHFAYVLIIGLGWMAAKYLVSDRQKTWATYLLIASFFILGISSMWTWNDVRTWSKGSGGSQVAATSPGCDGNPTTYLYDQLDAKYSLGDVICQKRAYVKEGCVSWLDSSGKRLGRTCNGPMPNIDGINYLKPETAAVVITNRCRPFAPGNLVEKCA